MEQSINKEDSKYQLKQEKLRDVKNADHRNLPHLGQKPNLRRSKQRKKSTMESDMELKYQKETIFEWKLQNFEGPKKRI